MIGWYDYSSNYLELELPKSVGVRFVYQELGPNQGAIDGNNTPPPHPTFGIASCWHRSGQRAHPNMAPRKRPRSSSRLPRRSQILQLPVRSKITPSTIESIQRNCSISP